MEINVFCKKVPLKIQKGFYMRDKSGKVFDEEKILAELSPSKVEFYLMLVAKDRLEQKFFDNFEKCFWCGRSISFDEARSKGLLTVHEENIWNFIDERDVVEMVNSFIESNFTRVRKSTIKERENSFGDWVEI